MRLKSILNGSNRQFIRITDVDMLETIEALLPHYDSFNALANDALRYGLPLLLSEKMPKQITLADEPKYEERTQQETMPQCYENALDPRIDEVIRLLSEIVMNTTLDKLMLSGLFNAKIQELENTPKLASRLSRGLLNNTPDCLYNTVIDMLKDMNKDEEDE